MSYLHTILHNEYHGRMYKVSPDKVSIYLLDRNNCLITLLYVSLMLWGTLVKTWKLSTLWFLGWFLTELCLTLCLYALSGSLQYHIPHICISFMVVKWISDPQYCTSWLSYCLQIPLTLSLSAPHRTNTSSAYAPALNLKICS